MGLNVAAGGEGVVSVELCADSSFEVVHCEGPALGLDRLLGVLLTVLSVERRCVHISVLE